MKVMLSISYGGKEPGETVELPAGVADALVNHRKPSGGIILDEKGKPKKKPGPSEVK